MTLMLTPLPLPFDLDDTDFEWRPLLEPMTPYAWPIPAICTWCRHNGDNSKKEGVVIVKHPHERFTLGWVAWRCPVHQEYWENQI